MSEARFYETMETLKALMAECRLKIAKTLEELCCDPDIRFCQGVHSAKNDYSMYYWIEAWYDDKKYTVNLFYNEIDSERGGCCTRFGRIMFATDFETAKQPDILKGSERESPPAFCSYKWHDPLEFIENPDNTRCRLHNRKWFTVDDVLSDSDLCVELADAIIKFVTGEPNEIQTIPQISERS